MDHTTTEHSYYTGNFQTSEAIYTGGACVPAFTVLQAVVCFGLKHVFWIIYISFLWLLYIVSLQIVSLSSGHSEQVNETTQMFAVYGLSSEFCIDWIGRVQEHRCLASCGEETLMQTHCCQLKKSISGLAIEVRNILGSRGFGKRPEPSNMATVLTSVVLVTGCLLLTWTIILLHSVISDWCHTDELIKPSSKMLEEGNWCLSDHSLC